ncbi:hypothetical protein GCM10025863_18720 [Microbacterium suwonense]|uniref:Uncharacterized protein n=1 Tax=Microbacterium suwonense TaxID=683047 RepID=A0ABN6X5F2_9MICO|nr:hypothetical protein GCM10025863_18720 [Microbacterium suwonense]
MVQVDSVGISVTSLVRLAASAVGEEMGRRNPATSTAAASIASRMIRGEGMRQRFRVWGTGEVIEPFGV